MEIARRDFFIKDKITIDFIGDVHEGNCNHDSVAFKKSIAMIEKDPNRYWVGLGDYIDSITVHDLKRFDPKTIAETYKLKDLKDLPYKQMEVFFNNIKPIENKCLALITGNHEEAYGKHNSSNIMARFTDMFTNPPPRLGYMGFLKLGFNWSKNRDRPKQTILCELNHGCGGGGYREGYPTNKVHDVFRWTEADVRVMGHIHQIVTDSKMFKNVNQVDQYVEKEKWFGCSGSYLKTYVEGNTNYFEHKGAFPTQIGHVKLEIKVVSDKLKYRLVPELPF